MGKVLGDTLHKNTRHELTQSLSYLEQRVKYSGS